MRVSEVMSFGAQTIGLHDSVQRAAETMRAGVVGVLPVVEDGELVGVITDRDIAVRAVARDARAATTRVGDIMTPEPVTCTPDEAIATAAGRMIAHGLRRLIVLEGDAVTGILSVDDLALVDETSIVAARVLHELTARRGTEMDGTLGEVRHP